MTFRNNISIMVKSRIAEHAAQNTIRIGVTIMKKIIPTPQKFEYSSNTTLYTEFSRIECALPENEVLSCGLQMLKEQFSVGSGDVLSIVHSDDPFFNKKNAKEQGYILKRYSGQTTVFAQSQQGAFYGLMTLLQLHGEAPDTFTIYDRPQIRFRGIKNTLWAETGVWSYDFGDGMENAIARIQKTMDQMARSKLNLMYYDGYGWRTERFPGYDALVRSLAEYGKKRGILLMTGGYGMSYGSAGHNNSYQGRVFYNRRPYPDGELYDCIGTYDRVSGAKEITLKGRSFGTCLSNLDLIDDKISEIRNFMQKTGVRVLKMHHMDADEIHEPLWKGRCAHCREVFPNDDLYAADGCAGAFASFFDRILDSLLPEFPDMVLSPVSPGYAYAKRSSDETFEKCRKFWSAITSYVRNKDAFLPAFRELFYQHETPELRFALLGKEMPRLFCSFFSSGDGFYSDKIYTPSAAYAALLSNVEALCAFNGMALHKPTMIANAEYFWNPTNSAFWNVELMGKFESQFDHYNAFREGFIRPAGIYGDGGLLETSCALLFGDKYAKRIADVFRIRGKNGESPIFTACNVELWTNYTKVNFPMLWDEPATVENQQMFRERFSECALATASARDILEEILQADDLSDDTREHLTFLHLCTVMCAKLCSQLTRYMDLYMEADRYFVSGTAFNDDIYERCEALIRDANTVLATLKADGRKAFDPLGGVLLRREEMFEFVAYCTGQIAKSLRTNNRVPEDRKPLNVRTWW